MPTTTHPAIETSVPAPTTPAPKRAHWRRATGPRTRARTEMVLPFRMEAAIVKRLDKALQRAGFTSRTEFMRKAMADALKRCGERELAGELAPPKARAA